MGTALGFIAAAFVIGFLLGDRRGTRQANEVLAANNQVLLEAMQEASKDTPAVEEKEERPTVH